MSLFDSLLHNKYGSALFLIVVVIYNIELVLSGFACLKNPCQHGICIDDINSPHQCYCQNGFTGYSCEINWDECITSPCLNGGTCVDGIASFNCTCPETFAGTYCEYDLSNCECQNNGTCQIRPEEYEFSNTTGYYCACPLGFTGERCEEDVSVCNTTQNICLNGGKCIDGIGNRFYCQCLQGWSGSTCEINIDECSSQPCQNGGVCIDLVNDYSCACPFGYTGRSCETKLKICTENPCKNDGFCLEEDGDPICYCVPDFHGILCEEQYNECEPGPKCFNNGTCIDGVGEFSCSCPPNFYGPICQCTAENMTEPECQMTNSTSTTTAFPPSDTTMITITTSVIVPTPTITIIDQTEGVIMTPSLPITDELKQTTYSIDESAITMSFYPSTFSIIGTEELTITGTPMTEIPFPSDELTLLTLPPTDEVTILPTPSLSQAPEPESTDFIGTTSLLSPSGTDIEMTVSFTRTSIPVPDQKSSFFNWTGSDFLTLSDTMYETEVLPTLLTPIVPDRSDSMTLFPPTSSPHPSESIEPSSPVTDGYETITFPIETSIKPDRNDSETTVSMTSEGPTSSIPTSQSEPAQNVSAQLSTSATNNITITTPMPEEITTSQMPGIITHEPGFKSTTLETRLSTPTTDSTISSTPKETVMTITGLASSVPLTTISFTPDTPSPPSSTEGMNVTNPCENYCQNNAKCISTTIETLCICPFKFTGKQCEREAEKVSSPSFQGNSFLKYKLPKETRSVVDINVEMATVAPDGIILYTNSFNNNNNDSIILNTFQQNISYGLIFLQNGHITLHFSCGSQSMQFIETRTKVNNGYNFTLQFSLDMKVDGTNLHEVYCIGKLSVNNSYIMTGEQLVGKSSLPIFEYIYIGGVDSNSRQGKSGTNYNDIVSFVPGFRGCIYGLMINKESRDLYDDAMDGKGIQECETLSCSVNPCFGASKCVLQSKSPFWQCICPDGYIGPTCKIRVCKENPCKNGATCTHSPLLGAKSKTSSTSNILSNLYNTESNTTCLCPLGFSGSLCQSRITISKPSFHPTKSYASYMSYYGIPRLDEWFQLKFHFVTNNLEQISLMLFVGNSNSGLSWSKTLFGNATTERVDENLFEHEEQQIEPSISIPELYDTSPIEPHNIDFFAVSFLRGYIGITWNLGSGTQRILTPSRMDARINVHTLYVGRSGRQAWIKLDGMKNISGRTRGPLYRLNVDTDLYIGGHEAYGLEGLPHDLSLHSGFKGCIFDLGFRVKNKLFIPRSFKGRNIKNCFEDC